MGGRRELVADVPVGSHAGLLCESQAFAAICEELLKGGVAVRFVARGLSMWPLLRDGDKITVRSLGSRTLRVGDVVLCSSEHGHLLAHRVVRRRRVCGRWALVVQGDQVSKPDGVYGRADILGRVVTVERQGRLMSLDAPVVRMLGIAAALRTHWRVKHGHRSWWAARVARRLPGFRSYLSWEAGGDTSQNTLST